MEPGQIDLPLLKKAQSGDDQALTAIYLANKNLIYALLKRFHYREDEVEDLVSVASMGLIKAIQNYDTAYQVQFSTYAVPLILGEIRRYFRDQSSLKVSRSLKELAGRISEFSTAFRQEQQREPNIEDIAAGLEISAENVMLALEASYKPTSLDKSLVADEDLTLKDTLGEDNTKLIDRYLDLDLAMKTLDKKEQLFVHLRYYEGLTQQQIADRLYVNQVYVSRLEKAVLAKMRERLEKVSR